MVDYAGGPCDDSLDCECNRDIDKISAQKVCHRRTDAGCKQSPDRSEDDAGQDDDSVSRMYISACSRGRNSYRHGCDTS